jgi:hypothetical protein
MARSVAYKAWKALDPDEPKSILGEIRSRRWMQLVTRFPELADMTVLDLGGTARAWFAAPVRPARLVILNTDPSGDDDSVTAEIVVGDACAPPASISRDHFDLVYSNSVLEHVGGHDRRKLFADTVRTAAVHHWVQTPYRYFPVEPHFLFPGFQFLPLAARSVIVRHWGPTREAVSAMPDRDVVDFVQAIELLSVTDMTAYFPDSQIERERLGGMVKSLIAIR